jgi:hypothetical protein
MDEMREGLIARISAVLDEARQRGTLDVRDCTSISDLRDYVREIEQFSIFDNTFQILPSGGSAFGRDDLADWLARRSQRVGPGENTKAPKMLMSSF